MEPTDLVKQQQKVTMLRAEGKYKETIEASYELLERGLEINDYKSILTAHINNAASFYCIGDLEEAFNSIDFYSEICRSHGDDADYVNLYNVLFLLYDMNKDYAKAKETLNKTIELAKKIEKYNIISNAYSNPSHVYMVEENFEQALACAKLGLEAAKLHEPATPILEFRVKLNLAKATIYLGDLHTSKQFIDEMLVEPFLDSFIREKAQCYDLLGAWHMKNESYRESYEAYTNAKQLVEQYNDVNLLKTIHEYRCKLCELMNEIELGFNVQKEYIAVLSEISERQIALAALKLEIKHSISAIKAKANFDYLTGVYNRNYLEETTNEWLEQATISKQSVVCLALDIDNFKGINDEFGHLFGDEAIKHLSNACASVLVEGDEIIGRYGGDEFVVILNNRSLEEGLEKAKEIEESIRNAEIRKNQKSIIIQVSIGAAHNEAGAVTTFKDLFHAADMALYKAKKGGKNQICVSR